MIEKFRAWVRTYTLMRGQVCLILGEVRPGP